MLSTTTQHPVTRSQTCEPLDQDGSFNKIKDIVNVTSADKVAKKEKWLESLWSEDTWTSTDSDGTSAVGFCMAVRCGYLKQVQQMLEERPQLISVINNNNGYTPLATAVRKAWLFYALEPSTDNCGKMLSRGKGHVSAELLPPGDVGMVKYLVSADAELEQRSSTGQTPLHLAVLAGHIAVADLLLEKGADFQVRDRRSHWGSGEGCGLQVAVPGFNPRFEFENS
ncbi:jg15676 [Pararge aegeria aegeria]|uniref:Jg15676 protein n=1 Tax=Pararge aegeria aegeria TaxID=348720 RepID=A0A8S4S6U1_9NEOP|nr:jg15676 [Pararge aegeria aegeria]